MNHSIELTTGAFEAALLWVYAGRLGVNLLTLLLLVGVAYRPNRYNRDAVFTFCTFNLLIFFLCSLLLNCQIRLEFAFGLFAVFSMLRYRTASLGMRDMTYLFAAICIGLMNAMDIGQQNLVWLTDGVLIGAVVVLERLFLQDEIGTMTVTLDNLKLVKGENSAELRQALSERTGLEVLDYHIGTINYSEGFAKIQVYFKKNKRMPVAVE